LNIYCSDDELEKRLIKRPQWGNCQNKKFIDKQKEFNNWVKNYGKEKKPEIELIDTTDLTLEKTVENVRIWINEKMTTKFIEIIFNKIFNYYRSITILH